MTPGDVARVLAKAAAFDQRTIGETDVLAWHEAINDLDATDALEAVTRHYRESRERLWPVDVRRIADEIDRERRRAVRERLELEAAERDRQERVPVATENRSAEVDALVRAVADSLPQPDVHARAVARARAERGRPYVPPAKERRKPKRPKEWPDPATDEVARLATRYLLDGYAPADVAERLAVSKRWCEKTIRRLRTPTEEPA